MMRGAVFAGCLCVCACGSGDEARVRLDLSALWQASGQSVATIQVRVFDASGTMQLEDSLTGLGDLVDLVVLAGPSLRFEIEALTAKPTPAYWGETVRTLSPGEDVDLVIPVFPAGGVAGTVTATDATPIPADAVALATAVSPRADAPAERSFALVGGTFSGTLPDGDYVLSVSYAGPGAPYSGSLRVTVVREAILADLGIQVGP